MPYRSPSFGLLVVLSLLLAPIALAGGPTPTEMGSGTAWLDCDADGDLDLLYLSPHGGVYLWENQGGSFVDVSETALPEVTRTLDAAGMGVTCADFDNDGHVDVFLAMEGQNLLLMNDGAGAFIATTKASGITGTYLTSSVGVIDYNNDGRADLYVANYSDGTNAQPNQFYRNDGVVNGVVKFTDVAPAMGMDLVTNGGGNWSLGVAVADYDNDGDPDLYVANDYDGHGTTGGGLKPGPNVLWRNEGNGTFTDVSVASGANEDGWAMGVTFGDYDGDGWLDIFLANFWEDALLHNNGDGTFTDVTRDVGLITDEIGEWHYNGWGTAMFDFDNDGDLDIYVNNGYILNDQGQILIEPNQLWENVGVDGNTGHVQFEEVAARIGLASPGDGRGAALGDFNDDGYVDIMAINNAFLVNGPERLLYRNAGDGTFEDFAYRWGMRDTYPDAPKQPAYKNNSANDWIKIGLTGTQSNVSCMGARITVTAGGRTHMMDVGASSYCSQNSPYHHFGLGDVDVIDEIVVRYPSGEVQVLTGVAPRQTLHLVEPDLTPVRLLGFDLASEPGGVRVSWRWADDGDLSAFALHREENGIRITVASDLRPVDGAVSVLDPAAPAGREVTYILEAFLRDGSRETLRVASFFHRPGTVPVLGAAMPNPFLASTRIPVSLPEAGRVSLEILDVTGRRMRTLDAVLPAGENHLVWDGADQAGRAVAAGTYFYRLVLGDATSVRKVIRVQ
jgi:hypothetical protein